MKYEYQLQVKKNLKHIYLEISKTGVLIIKAPVHLKEEDIKELMETKKKWLDTKYRGMDRKFERRKKYLSLDYFWYLGQGYEKKYRLGKFSSLEFVGTQVLLPMGDKEAEALLIKKFYRQQEPLLISKLQSTWGSAFSKYPEKIGFRRQKSVWGTCLSKGHIHLNRALMKSPWSVLSYVYIHEMCHLMVPNHSPKFWEEVAKRMPEYKKQRAWLKEYGELLFL